MKRFSLRGLLGFVLAISLVLWLAADWYRAGSEQKRKVEALIQLDIETEKLGPQNRVIISFFYDKDLVWVEQLGRYAWNFQERKGVSKWLNDCIGIHFFESPTAIEIFCPNCDESKIPDAMVKQINQLDSVKQIWITDRYDSLTDEATRKLIHKLFPNLIAEYPSPTWPVL